MQRTICFHCNIQSTNTTATSTKGRRFCWIVFSVPRAIAGRSAKCVWVIFLASKTWYRWDYKWHHMICFGYFVFDNVKFQCVLSFGVTKQLHTNPLDNFHWNRCLFDYWRLYLYFVGEPINRFFVVTKTTNKGPTAIGELIRIWGTSMIQIEKIKIIKTIYSPWVGRKLQTSSGFFLVIYDVINPKCDWRPPISPSPAIPSQ